ncbi:DUF805 domain-containing protein [Agromyces sp. NPDC004153]
MTDVTADSAQVPLDAPLRGATFGQAFSRFFKKYATFHGRASRSEYWWWFLGYYVISGVLYGLTYTMGNPMMVMENGVPTPVWSIAIVPYALWGLATLIPFLAIHWRRLHDTNRAGPWWFIGWIPIVGPIILLVFLVGEPKPEGARFDR